MIYQQNAELTIAPNTKVLTRGKAEMRTRDKDATNTKNPRHNDDPHSHRPISPEGSQPIGQLAKEEQEGHLDGKDGDPAYNLSGEGQLLVVKNIVHEVRRHDLLQHVFTWAQDQAHVKVNILKHDVDEREGSDQPRAAEQQGVVVGGEALLVTEPDGDPANGREHGCGEEHRNNCLLCFSVMHALMFWRDRP